MFGFLVVKTIIFWSLDLAKAPSSVFMDFPHLLSAPVKNCRSDRVRKHNISPSAPVLEGQITDRWVKLEFILMSTEHWPSRTGAEEHCSKGTW